MYLHTNMHNLKNTACRFAHEPANMERQTFFFLRRKNKIILWNTLIFFFTYQENKTPSVNRLHLLPSEKTKHEHHCKTDTFLLVSVR